MRTLRCDSIGGASGDMILSLLAALGVDLDGLQILLSGLCVEPFELRREMVTDRGVSGVRVTVDIADDHHPHRNLDDIEAIISRAELAPPVAEMSLRVFRRLAEAEAAVHGTTIDKIHFHEVGAMDAIVDIVGCCAGLHLLGVDAVQLGELPVGRGTVACVHGQLPLPVPAVAELLKGFGCVQTDEPFELVTPTGAALLTTWARERPAEQLSGTVETVGYGIGQRSLSSRANCLRGMLLTSPGHTSESGGLGNCLVIECNLDDTVPELLGTLCGKLLQHGVLDVFTAPVQMKKQRPGTVLTVLAKPEDHDTVVDLIFRETTTFGVRSYAVERTMLLRRIETVTTPYGEVRVKIGTWRGEDITRSPEHDDCAARAESAGVSVRTVFEAASRACGETGE